MTMSRTPLPTALLVVGIALLVAPALFPLQPVLVHDTHDRVVENETVIEERGFRVVEYENLTERGQQLYVEALRNGGEYQVPLGQGASDFAYPTPGELGQARDYEERQRLEAVVIERPEDDSDLPPPDEPVDDAHHLRERYEHRYPNKTPPSEAELREQIGRYDLLTTRTVTPDPGATAGLSRFGPMALGVLALGVGGYLRSKPR